MPNNDTEVPQNGVSGAQPTPRAVTVETTLEAITGLSEAYIESAYWSPTLKAEALAHRAKVRALLEALGAATRETLPPWRTLLDLQAENARLRAALAAAQEWGVRYAADSMSVPTPPQWGPENWRPEKKEVDNG